MDGLDPTNISFHATVTQREIMTRTIWGESEGEPWLGKLAVAAVILNRVFDKRWPNTIIEVCLQPAQFSCWNMGTSRLFLIATVDTQSSSYIECESATMDLTINRRFFDPIMGATHFHAINVMPKWAKDKKPVYVIARHMFYNDVD